MSSPASRTGGVRLGGNIPRPPYSDQQRDQLLYRIAENVEDQGEELRNEIHRNSRRIWWLAGCLIAVLGTLGASVLGIAGGG